MPSDLLTREGQNSLRPPATGDKTHVSCGFNFRLEQGFLSLTCSHFYADMSESVEPNKLGKGTNHGFQVAHIRQGQASRTRA